MQSGGVLPLQAALALGGWGTSANVGASMTLNNAATNVNTRLADTQAIDSYAGEVIFTTNGATATSETAGALRGAGMTTVSFTSGGTLTFADLSLGLTRADRGTFLFRSSNGNLGVGPAATTQPNLIFRNNVAGQLIGSGGADGTTTISILPYAVGGMTVSDTGSNFVTYGANGVRVLNPTTEVQLFLIGAGATENVRTAFTGLLATSTLAADQTINALNIAGAANKSRFDSASTQKLTLTSGLLLATSANVWSADFTGSAGVALGVQTAELRAGAANTSELHVFASADLALGAAITTTGGLTKSGAGMLFLTNAANTYTGPTTINAGLLTIDDQAALGVSTSLIIGGGFLRYRGADTTFGFPVLTAGGGSAGFDVTSGVSLTLSPGSVAGGGGILKTGTGVLKLQGTNMNTGATIIAGGALAIDGPAALGSDTRVIFSTGTSASGGQTLRFDAPMTLTHDFITNTSDATVGFGFDTNGNDVTLSGTIASATSTRGVFKIGAGNLTLTAAGMWSGPTHVLAGTLTLAGANGSIVPATGTAGYFTAGSTLLLPGTSLVLDNTSVNNNNRLPDVWDSPFGQGNNASGGIYIADGEFKIRGNASAATSERVNQFILQLGTITLENNGQNVTLTSGQFVRQNVQTVGLIRGTNLGALPGATSTNYFLTDLGGGSTTLGGARGAEGTPFVGIIPGIVGDTSATGVGTELTTYSADTGVRLLAAGEYTSTIPVGNYDTSRAPNVALGGAVSVATQTSISALKLGPGASVNGGGALTLTASTVFATGSASINTPVLRAETNAGYAFITAGAGTTLTIYSALNGTTFFKYGEGTLALTNAYFAGGASSIVAGQGTLLLSGANAGLTPLGAQVFVLKGATLDLGGMDRTIATLGNLGFLGTAQGGGQIASEGTIALGANRLTFYDTGAGFNWAGSITGSGGLTKGLFSTGATVFTQPLAFTGSTIIHAGTLTLTGRATLASTQIDVRGGTLLFDNRDDFAFAGGYVANRVPTGGTINLAGALFFTENANTTAVHTLGTVNLVGNGFLTIPQISVTAPSTTTIANLTRAASKGTLTLTATSLGLAQSANGNARIFATQIDGAAPASALIGGGGAVNTTTVSIVPWAWSSTAPTSFVTYGADGFRPLATSEYATDLGSANATTNVRLASGQTLTGPAMANALITGGAVSANPFGADLTLTSGALAFIAPVIAAVGNGLGDRLLTGNGNANELVISNVSNSTLQMLYTLQGSGGLTKFGPGILAFTSTSPANNFTGGIRIHEGLITYTNDAQLGAASNTITFGGTTASLATRGLEYNGNAKVVELNRNLVLNGLGVLTMTPINLMRINGTISGAGALGFSHQSSAGLFEINGANTATGDIMLNKGYLAIRSDADLGAGSAVQLNNANANEGLVLRGDWTTSKTLHVRAVSAVNTNGHDATLNGLVIGTANLTKLGAGTLTLTAPNPYSSGTLTVSGGSVVLKDRGALGGSFPSVSAGYALVLDDTGAHFPDRLPSLTFNLSGGELALKGSSSATSEEVIGSLSFNGPASAVTLAAGSGQAAVLRISGGNGFTLGLAGRGIVFRGTNLGVNAPGTANSATIIMTETNSVQQSGVVNMAFLTGGAAAAGSPSVSIIKGAFGDTSATGLGTQLVTYDLDKGVRLLSASEYASALVDGSVATDNVRVNGTSLALLAPTTANALWLSGGSINTTNPLTLTSGTVLVTGTGNTIAGAITSGSTNALVIGGPGNLTINDSIPNTTTGGLIKEGAGTLTLNGANSFTGQIVLAGGAVNIGTTNALGSVPGLTNVQFQGGEVRNTSGAPIAIANNIIVEGAGIAGGAEMKVGGAQDIDFQGAILLNNSSKTIEVTNTGTTTISGGIGGTPNVPGIGFTKTGPGTLVLTNANTFGDPSDASFYESKVTLSAGVLSIPSIANGGIASPLGKSPADADHLVFDGGTLRYTGGGVSTDRLFTITPNGGRLDSQSSGALTLSNTGSIVASGSGPRTFTLDGALGNTNVFTPMLTSGATSADKLSLVVDGATWRTPAAHTFTGTTTITGGGTFQLVGSASLAGTSAITINTSSTFDESGVTSGASFDGTSFQILSGQTLRGNGTLLGGLHTLASSTLDIGALSPIAAEQLTLSTPTTSSYDFDGTFTLDLWQNQSGLTAGEADRAVFSTSGASTVALGGTLQLRLGAGSGLDSLAFAEGDQWQLFNWATLGVSGSFTTYDLPATGPGRGWDVSQLATTGVLVVIPEPGAAMLTLLGLGALAARRRR